MFCDDVMHPRVGITSYLAEVRWGQVWQQMSAFIPQQYLDFVTAGGGVPILLPLMGEHVEVAVDGIDALVLSGGPDVSPDRYGSVPGPDFEWADVRRDAWEFALVEAAMRRGIPVLAICRGMQVLNAARGGTLHQHLPSVVHNQDHRVSVGTFTWNGVRTVEGSRLASIVGSSVSVPCHHHQAVAELGASLLSSAVAGDGTVEAIEDPGSAFIVGVQWHPEEDTDYSLATALVEAARVAHDVKELT